MFDEDEKLWVKHSRQHDYGHSEELDCVCKPKIMKRCSELCDTGCWACEKGWVQITLSEAQASQESLHVIHNEL